MKWAIPPSLCLACRGAKLLCGLAYCPIILEQRARARSRPPPKELTGSSPPSLFVGRYDYPKVRVGPLAPPIAGDTSRLEMPEGWVDKRIEDIVEARISLVGGFRRVPVLEARDPSGYLQHLQLLAMSSSSVQLYMEFDRISRARPTFDDHHAPFGPSGTLNRLRLEEEPRTLAPLEKAYYDVDLGADEAIRSLYSKGVSIYALQRAFSLGCLGSASRRRLVPTRWGITAVDDIASKHNIFLLKRMQDLDKPRVFRREVHLNRFVALLLPRKWAFEWIEAWFPRTTWNLQRQGEPELLGDHELHRGRKDYAKVGGCYYAARLAVSEYLVRERRQAMAILLREIYPGFTLPLGVWFVREQLREMFRSRPLEFESEIEAIGFALSWLNVPRERWLRSSSLLQLVLVNRSLHDFALQGGVHHEMP